MRILITAGGTEEPIDGVRFITNFSTGSTGANIADNLLDYGFDVTLITSRKGISPSNDIKTRRYTTFDDLNKLLKKELKHGYDAVIHAAAVSDYSIDYLEVDGKELEPDVRGKLDSSSEMKIALKRNIKIVDNLKAYSKKELMVIAFKLTNNGDSKLIESKIEKLFSNGVVDFVIHNDLTSIVKDLHRSKIFSPMGELYSGKTKKELSNNIIKLFNKEI